MNFVEVKEIPYTTRARKGFMEERLEQFMHMHVKYVKVTYSAIEYSCPTSCRMSFANAAKRYNFPVDTKMINGEVYLIRRDM